ncbi:MAG: UbiA family prenyltransferase [Planctomycetales bacterium]|nr:UbiA family prenyltransferase [Planctomycetales bacterium]
MDPLPYLRLVRAPNCLTAVADALAGAALAWSYANDASLTGVAAAALASVCFYGGGCALNDWADREHDRIAHPERPIPSGAVSPAAAYGLGAALLALGLLGAMARGGTAAAVGAAVATAVVLYDLVLKVRPVPGAFALAAARGGNLALGTVMTAGSFPTEETWLFGPGLLALYALGVTLASTREEIRGSPASLAAFVAIPAVAALAVPGLIPRAPIAAALPALTLVALLARPGLRAVREGTPDAVGGFVRAAVLGVPLFDCAIALGAGQWVLGGAILALVPPARLLARRIAT